MKLDKDLAMVASGDGIGFGLTHRLDCSVYLLDGGGELALIDAGTGLETDQLLGHVKSAGYEPEEIKYLLLTHGHYDHAGGCRELYDRLGVKVLASPEVAYFVEKGDEEGICLARAKRAGMYPEECELRPCPVEEVVREGDVLEIGEARVRTINTPGHSAGHVCYLVEGPSPTLFSGDSVLAGGRIILQNIPDCLLEEYVTTIKVLSELKVERLLPGHGVFALQRGREHLQVARDIVDGFRIPPNIIA
jgi:glyoxylase-like metal-dependent hydrolase (beta-lactamase superfamily II)